MSDLMVNYGATKTVGEDVIANGEEFQEELDKIIRINSDLQTYWKGSDATTYTDAVNEQAEIMQKLSDIISKIGQFLMKVGKAYEEACDSNKRAIN